MSRLNAEDSDAQHLLFEATKPRYNLVPGRKAAKAVILGGVVGKAVLIYDLYGLPVGVRR